MTGAAGLCARARLPGRGRHGPPRACPVPTLAESPAAEAVGVALPGRRLGRPRPSEVAERCRAVVVGPGPRAAPRRPRPRCGAWWPESPVPVVVDADGLFALGPARRWRAPAAGRAPWCSPRTTASTPGCSGTAPGPDRIAAARRLAASAGAVALLKGPTTAVADPGGTGPAGHGRHAAPGHRRHRRRAVRGDRGVAGPGRGTRWRRPRWLPTSTVGPAGLGPGRGAGGRGPARPGGRRCSSRAAGPADLSRTEAGHRWLTTGRPALGRGRPRRPCGTIAATLQAGTGRARGPLRGGQGRRLRPRGAARGPGRPGGRGRPGWRWPWSRRGWRCARPASRPRSCCCPSPRPEADGRGRGPPARSHRLHRRRRSSRLAPGGGRDGRPVDVHLKVDTGMHRVGADPATAWRWPTGWPSDPRLRAGRRCGPTWRWPTAAVPRTGPSPPGSSSGSSEVAGPGRCRAPAAPDPRRQLGRGHRPPGGPLRHGALRDRPLRGCPAPAWPTRWLDRPGGGQLRPVLSLRPGCTYVRGARRRGARPPTGGAGRCRARSTVATVPLGYADGRAPGLFDAGRRGARRRGAAARWPGGHHGPDHDRLRAGGRPGGGRRRGGALGRQGDEEITADGVGRRCSGPSATRCCATSGRGCRAARVGEEPAEAVGPGTGRRRGPRPSTRPPPGVARARAVPCGRGMGDRTRRAGPGGVGLHGCPLSATRTQVVFGVGDPDSRSHVRGRGPRPRRGPRRGSRSSAARASCSTG